MPELDTLIARGCSHELQYIRRAAFAAGLLFALANLSALRSRQPGQLASAPVANPLPFVSPIFGDNMVLAAR